MLKISLALLFYAYKKNRNCMQLSVNFSSKFVFLKVTISEICSLGIFIFSAVQLLLSIVLVTTLCLSILKLMSI